MRRIYITLPDALDQKLKEYCRATGVSVPSYIRMAVTEFMKTTEMLKGLEFLSDYLSSQTLAEKKKEGGETDEGVRET